MAHASIPCRSNIVWREKKSFYFSPLYNCLFDCSYCFLQGFFRSAHLLLFVNFEEYFHQIEERVKENSKETIFFFSGYECDSLGCEHISSFLREFLPFFEKKKESFFELRTKSNQIAPLINRQPIEHCIIAFSLTPSCIAKAFEKRAPSLEQRIQAMRDLQQTGWKIALRFDPLIYYQGFEEGYEELFSTLFSTIDAGEVHSATIGSLRYPKDVYKNMRRLDLSPELLAPLFENEEKIFGYTKEIKEKLFSFCEEKLSLFLPKEKIFKQEKL